MERQDRFRNVNILGLHRADPVSVSLELEQTINIIRL